MKPGSNKCAACGRWSGKGHKCPPKNPAVPQNSHPIPSAHDSSRTLANDVNDRVSRAAGFLSKSEHTNLEFDVPAQENRILVKGDIDRDSLKSALYGGWRVGYFHESSGINKDGRARALLSAPLSQDEGFGPKAQAARIASFGSVSVSVLTPDVAPSEESLREVEEWSGLKRGEYYEDLTAGQVEDFIGQFHDAREELERIRAEDDDPNFDRNGGSKFDDDEEGYDFYRDFTKTTYVDIGVDWNRLDEVTDAFVARFYGPPPADWSPRK